MRAKFIVRAIALGLGLGLLVMAAALAVGAWQYSSATRALAAQILDTAQSVRKFVDEQRTRRLADFSTSIATDQSFVASISKALNPGADTGESRNVAVIRDLLDSRRREAGLDAAAILDASGTVVATVGDSFLAEHNLSILPSVAQSRRTSAQVSGTIEDDKRLPLVCATPITRNSEVEAVLVTGLHFDEAVLKTMAQVARIDFAIIAVPPTGAQVLSSSLGSQDAELLVKAIAERAVSLPDAGSAGHPPAIVEVDLDGETWSTRTFTLGPSARKTYVMWLVTPESRSAVRKAIAPALIAGSAAALLALLILIWILWHAGMWPLIRIVELSDRMVLGDYALKLEPTGTPLVRRVGRAFNHLLAELDRHRIPPGVPHRRATDRR